MPTATHDDGVRSFVEAYRDFLAYHKTHGSGASQDRVRSGLGHAEREFLKRVWWPIFHNFDRLYPEYEIQDFFDVHRYIDFAYIQPRYRIAFEIEGYGPHWKDITIDQFSSQCHRNNHLVIDEWRVLRFSYKAVMERPRVCQQTVEHLIGRLTGRPPGQLARHMKSLKPVDRDVVQLAYNLRRPIEADDIALHLHVSRATAFRHLQHLSELGFLQATADRQRVHKYRLHPNLYDLTP